MKHIAILLAGGTSQRFGGDKLLTEKFGMPVLSRTLDTLEQCTDIDEIVLVGSTPNSPPSKVRTVLPAGEERFFSLCNALAYLREQAKENARIIVHNAANPFLTPEELSKGIALSKLKKNVIFGFFTPNSVKEVRNGKVNKNLVREQIFETQTPQISDLHTLLKALDTYRKNPVTIPRDEAELLSLIGEEIFIFECSPRNQKITTPHDFPENFRLGMGEDSHAFSASLDLENPVTLGGVSFPECEKSFSANSDGDVILHALCNAILSSVGARTLASFADEMCRQGDTDSQYYVQKALSKAVETHPRYEIQNVIVSLECALPVLSPRHEEVQRAVAKLLRLSPTHVGLTYTSGEALTPFGKGEAVRCTVEILAKI
ncbi:2-C-methyl-D-erythritol 2,4-cyclodiphosphate synthase [Candidatus Gracilibacteria bacterium]|nr:2-C-methyl-D-erythritol 2,4-cyclodiphosphate synthase [Candidatus Gracilibacteria bacterium]